MQVLTSNLPLIPGFCPFSYILSGVSYILPGRWILQYSLPKQLLSLNFHGSDFTALQLFPLRQ